MNKEEETLLVKSNLNPAQRLEEDHISVLEIRTWFSILHLHF